MRHRLNGGPDWMLSPPPPKHRKLSINFLFTFVMVRVLGFWPFELKLYFSLPLLSSSAIDAEASDDAQSRTSAAAAVVLDFIARTCSLLERRRLLRPSSASSSSDLLFRNPIHRFAFCFSTSAHLDDLQDRVDAFSTSVTPKKTGKELVVAVLIQFFWAQKL